MEFQCLLGLKCKDFSMIAADQMTFANIFVMKNDDEKIHKISDRMVVGVTGDLADSTHLLQYLTKHLQLYRMKNLYSLDIGAVAHFARYNLTGARLVGPGSQMPYLVNMLLAGYDDKEGGQLYLLDFLGSCIQVSHLGLGLGGMVSLSIMDRYYSPNLTEKEAYEILRLSAKEIHQRLVIQLPKFQVTMVSKDGIKQLPPLASERFANLA